MRVEKKKVVQNKKAKQVFFDIQLEDQLFLEVLLNQIENNIFDFNNF